MVAKIIEADAQHRAWMQAALQEEVVHSSIHKTLFTYLHIYTFTKLTIMCFVGIAMAIGQIFDIPIVLRSLAMSLSSNCRVKLPIPFNLGFVAMLEVGTNGNQMDRVVDSYAHDWWNDRTRTTVPKFQNMFTTETVVKCLAHHRKQLGAADPSIPLKYSNIIPPLMILPSTTNICAACAGRHDGADSSHAAQPCSKCDRYCALAASLYDELVGVKNFASILSVTSSNDVEVASRRASGFYSLHEKVTVKEMRSQPQHVTGLRGGSRTRLSERVGTLAAEDLKRFQNMPTSHKWTWGEALTAEDVLGLRHISRQREHTGYETTLKPGVLPGVFSATNTPPPSNAKFGSLPDPQSPPPPTPHRYPSNLGSLYRINESSDGASNPGSTWLDFEDGPLSNGADGSGSGDVAGKEDVDDPQVDGESKHTGTRISNAIYVSDSEESAVPATGAAPNADMAADLWLEEVEMGEEDTDDEYDESGGMPESDPIAAFELAPAQVAVEDLWFSPGMNHADLGSDEEVDDSDEEEDSDEENSDEDSGEVSDGAVPPKSNDSGHEKYASAEVAVNLWLEMEDVEEADDGTDEPSNGTIAENSDHAGQSGTYLPGSWLDDDDVDLGANSVGDDTHPTGSWLDDDAAEEVTSVTPSKITLPRRYDRGDFHLPSYLFMDLPEVDMDD